MQYWASLHVKFVGLYEAVDDPKKHAELTRRNSLADYNVAIRNEYISNDELEKGTEKKG